MWQENNNQKITKTNPPKVSSKTLLKQEDLFVSQKTDDISASSSTQLFEG